MGCQIPGGQAIDSLNALIQLQKDQPAFLAGWQIGLHVFDLDTAGPGRPAVRYFGLEAFGKLAHLAGWTIAQTLDGPMHQVVSLKKA